MAEFRGESRAATVSRRRGRGGEKKSLGTVHDQRFYAVRCLPLAGQGHCTMTMPFASKPYNALVRVCVPFARSVLQEAGLALLRHGLLQAVCCGCEGESMGEVLDELADEHGFNHNGRPAFASVHEDETLDEVLDYFILPNGQADTGLLVVLGDEAAFRETLRCFVRVAGELRERLYAPAL